MADSFSRSGAGGGSARHVESADALETPVETHERVLVDFDAEWCGPCQMMAPIVDELAAETDAAVAKVDVDEVSSVPGTHDVAAVPTFVVFEDGEPTDRFVGLYEKEDLQDALA